MSPETELDLSNMFLTQAPEIDYEELCKLDVQVVTRKPFT